MNSDDYIFILGVAVSLAVMAYCVWDDWKRRDDDHYPPL